MSVLNNIKLKEVNFQYCIKRIADLLHKQKELIK